MLALPPPQPVFAPASFAAHVTNVWFPLPPGRTLVYHGEEDGVHGRDVFTVTRRKQTILRVRATVVHDRVFLRGRLREDTLDYYAQDGEGNVWYMGEDTKELDSHGKVVTREGTWRAGRHGAKPGIFMPAHPRVGQSFQQEFYPGHAEDHFRVLSIGHTLKTREWTPLEPGVRDLKVYVRHKGTVREQTVKGGNERWKLVRLFDRP